MRRMSYRKILLMLADIFIMITSGMICYFIISLGDIGIFSDKRVILATLFGSIFTYLIFLVTGSYTKLWRFCKEMDYLHCVMQIAGGYALSYTLTMIVNKELSLGFWALYFMISSLGVCGFRFIFKEAFLALKVNIKREVEDLNKKRTLIIGAGQACNLIIEEMNVKSEKCEYKPVAIIDDDINKQHSKLKGIPIVGKICDINEICEKNNIEVILFAIPSCEEQRRKEILDICFETGKEVKVIPYFTELLFRNSNILNQFKKINIEDLLGRKPVIFDNENINGLIKDKVVMVTGGGGSIGSELCRQIAKYSPKALVIVDIYENNAYSIQQELIMEYGSALDLEVIISSVRDERKMEVIFAKYTPQIVFHAAAHKHVPLMETVPEEAVKNNIFGTWNVARIADKYQVEKFVLISTDKAVNPTNVMGATKRCCEMIVQYMSQKGSDTDFVAVRFGNVLGSNGSVIPLFKKQIENGKPVTITHPDIIRYFMTIPEAVSLVMQAGSMATSGEIFVLDMGKPVKIVTLAENLIKQYGKRPYEDVKIEFIGLRPGEKLFEELLMSEEGLTKTTNQKIYIGNAIEINQKEFINNLYSLKIYADMNDSETTIEHLKNIVPTFTHDICKPISVRINKPQELASTAI